MLRRHLWLVFFMTILGAGIGGGGWYLARRFLPLYQAETMIKVLPPVETDPMEIVASEVQQDIQYGHRVSLANLMKSQSSLQQLLQNDKVKEILTSMIPAIAQINDAMLAAAGEASLRDLAATPYLPVNERYLNQIDDALKDITGI